MALPPLRSSAESFEEARRIQQRIEEDFDRYAKRQTLFRKKFAAEARKHHQGICDGACSSNSSSSSVAALLFAQHDASQGDRESGGDHDSTEEAISGSKRYGRRDKNGKHADVFRALSCFYSPPDPATDVICEFCFGFRSSSLVRSLPSPWAEYCDETTGKHYFYHPGTRQVRWHPPAATEALSALVFERTDSVFTVCRCIPSKERRRRLMQKFREHALGLARQEAEQRDRHLRGAFMSLATSLVPHTRDAQDGTPHPHRTTKET
ncbi:hypothetical protein BBJ28_00008709 [Nothophytophthora sp. Chile5]|nr:hypothetical protein BBJ28_00008709 [Nothophytophthora sp. Chile5]